MSEVNKLFDKIKNGGLSQTEILNQTREFTNDYDPELLEAFYYDLRQYIDFLEDGFLAELKNKYPDWSKYIKKEFTDKNLEVPTEKIPKLETITKPKDEQEYHLVLDWKKVFWKDYSREFILLLDLRRIIQNKLEPKKDPLGHIEKYNLNPSTASNIETDTNTPKPRETTTAATVGSETVQIKDLSDTELALFCVLIGISPDKPNPARKFFEQTGRKNFRTLITAMGKVKTEKMRLSKPPNEHPKQILKNRRGRYEKFLHLLPPEFKEKAENEIGKLEKIIEDW